MYKEDLASNNLQWLIDHKTKPNTYFTQQPVSVIKIDKMNISFW